jgi:L-rhamnose isomerase/sugar isomerase
MLEKAYALFEEQQTARGIDLKSVKERIKAFHIETPSWGYSDSGTRFKVFQQTGVPRNVYEKIDDATKVHELTGICPNVAIHIPWDMVDDFGKLAAYAEEKGVKIGAVNPNLFQDNDYIYGSITNSDKKIRKKAVAHLVECVNIMKETGSKDLSLWFADGTNYPGQADFRSRKNWMYESLEEVYNHLSKDMRMLIEYKFFEPAFYQTDLADWGMAFNLANKLGKQAEVLVDTGHHPQGTNIEHIVAYLLDEMKLGGFHFNSRKYADDDLLAGSLNPYELYLTLFQIILAQQDCNEKVRSNATNISFMLDQCHNVEEKIPAVIRSVTNVQTQYAKALLVNVDDLKVAQQNQDVLAAESVIREGFEFDVTPLLQVVRQEMNVAKDPFQTYLNSAYRKEIQKRGKGGASW